MLHKFSNDVNNCKSGAGVNSQCSRQSNLFPAFSGTGNVCSGVELNQNSVPSGCGCSPSNVDICRYNSALQTDSKCFICTSTDIAAGDCTACVDCLGDCDTCIHTADGIDAIKLCLGSMDDVCRSNCYSACTK